MAMTQTGLVLQGGGALGAYELGALKRLYEEASFRPSIISGVSIGAITAATLVGARGDPIEVLEGLWRKLTMPSSPLVPRAAQRFLSLFGNPAFFRMRTDYIDAAAWTSYYDTSPLRATLEEFIDFERIRHSPVKLFLTATNVASGNIEVFDNRAITPDHVLASGALPPGFPMVEIDHDFYWDGGLFDNSPLNPVMESLDPSPDVPKQVVVINLFAGHGEVPEDMIGVYNRVLGITFSNKFQSDLDDARKVNDYIEVVNAIDQAVPADHPIRLLPGYARLKQNTFVHDILYIQNNNPAIVVGAFDFSERTIEARVHAGYRDAEAALKARPRRELPRGLMRSPA
jgi:predicted acylesterase/phospholipase RssA